MPDKNVMDLSEYVAKVAHIRDALSDSEMTDVMYAVGKKVGVAAEETAIVYPLQSGKPLPLFYTRKRPDGTTYKSKFKNMRQQRKVMGLIAKGKVPYRRTGLLGRTVTSDVLEATPNGATVGVGTNDQKAKYVVDADNQSFYHKGHWTTIQDNLANDQTRLQTVAGNTFVREIRKRVERD
jgi:hypothetical protein